MKTLTRWFSQYKRFRPLISELVKRDLKVKYRRSFLGYLWSLLNPLLMMLILNLVFSNIFRFDIKNYPLYLICGQTLYAFFNESTSTAMYSIIWNAQLIKKVYIPKYIFPIARIVSCFVTMSFSLVAILIVMIFTGTWPTVYFPLLIFPLFCLFIFTCGMGMILSSLSVYFRDVTHLYSVFTLALMYVTPIFYPISSIPPKIQIIIKLNPLYYYIDLFRSFVIYGQMPEDPMMFVWSIVSSVGFFILGLLVFKKLQRNFILYV